MLKLSISTTLCIFFLMIGACGGPTTSTPANPATNTTPESVEPEKIPKDEALNSEEPRSNREEKQNSEKKDFVFDGKKNQQIVPYELPEALRESKSPPPQRSFELVSPHLKIDVGNSRMSFTAILKAKGKKDEAIQMSCPFKKDEVPWTCNNMFPDDPKIAKQRRLQATINCLDSYKCSDLGFDFFVLIDGKKEVQHFESKPVSVRIAKSGDMEEDAAEDAAEDPAAEAEEPPPQKPTLEKKKKKDQSRLEETEVKEEVVTETPEHEAEEEGEDEGEDVAGEEESTEEEPALDEKQIDQIVKAARGDETVEYNGPITTPAPVSDSKFSIPGVAALAPSKVGKNARRQALRKHNGGQLLDANNIKPNAGLYIRKRDLSKGTYHRAFATDLMEELVRSATLRMAKKYSNRPPLVLGDVAKKTGSQLCRKVAVTKQHPKGVKCHKSHQTGLDADIAFPSKSKKTDLWDAVKGRTDLDIERFLFISKTLTCAKGSPVIAIFVDREIKRMACAHAKKTGEDLRNPKNCAYRALRHMRYVPGHNTHFHLRLRCPENLSCQNTEVTLPPGTGC